KIIPKYYIVAVTASSGDKLAACTRMTEDDHNEVVIDWNNFKFENESTCFSQHKVDLVAAEDGSDQKFLDSVRPYISTTRTAFDRQMVEMPGALAKAGYFDNGKVGIFADDFPSMHRNVDNVLVPALKRLGVTPLDIRYASVFNGSAQQLSQAQSQTQTAV